MKNNSILRNYIKQTSELNKVDLSNTVGDRLYINKFTAGLISFLYFIMVPMLVALMIGEIGNDMTWLISIILILLFTYTSTFYLSLALCKNPILILRNDELYNLKTNKWYKLNDLKFEDKHVGRVNLNLTYCITDKNDNTIFELNNWFLKNEDNFKAKIKINKLSLRK